MYLLKTALDTCKCITYVLLSTVSLMKYFFGWIFYHRVSMDTVFEQFAGIYYGLCQSHRFGSARPSGSQKSNKAIYPHQMPRGKAWRWGTVKSSYLGTVQSSSPAEGKVRQLLEGAGRAGERHLESGRSAKPSPSSSPCTQRRAGSGQCSQPLAAWDFFLFFLEKKLCLEGSHFSSAFRPSWVMGMVQLCYAKYRK